MKVALLSEPELKTPSDHCYEGSRGVGVGGGGGNLSWPVFVSIQTASS